MGPLADHHFLGVAERGGKINFLDAIFSSLMQTRGSESQDQAFLFSWQVVCIVQDTSWFHWSLNQETLTDDSANTRLVRRAGG
ncbi:hypothetical protein M514_06122 [Trichuris suis]|uniref:Uncharacterized protein n=1 Tax=Trichuris suis TaxID=68888 RepID=A0A085NK65_9BILA|nr:hypothetical protein M513_06122 [Trichuris suis]KFD69861.1 hypothetical protein M514_06122 [Trichuris suis]